MRMRREALGRSRLHSDDQRLESIHYALIAKNFEIGSRYGAGRTGEFSQTARIKYNAIGC
jgi:hypothetical protein